MLRKPIVVGVDGSPEAARAASFATTLAEKTGAACYLVHAVPEAWTGLAAVGLRKQVTEFYAALVAEAREQVLHALRGAAPPKLLERLLTEPGRAAELLSRVAAANYAELIVLGGKHHSTLERWLGGSTALNLVRTTDVPLLVTGPSTGFVRRVLVAVDCSAAAGPTLQLAEQYAALFGAELRVLSVIEPLPVIPNVPPYDAKEYYAMLEGLLEREIWPLVRTSGARKVVRYGSAVETILREATESQADLLVLGSHGKGWAERLLVGSTTEQVLNNLPTALLVVPVAAALKREAALTSSDVDALLMPAAG